MDDRTFTLSRSLARWFVWLGLLTLIVSGTPAFARVGNSVSVTFDDSVTRDFDQDEAVHPTSAELTETVSATIIGTQYAAQGSVSPFGQFGVTSSLRRTGSLFNNVSIRSDEHVNLTASPRQAVANFIIDGGAVDFVAGDGSSFSLQIELTAAIYGSQGDLASVERWQSSFTLDVPAGGFGQPMFQTFGEDIGATFDGGFHVDIPLTLQTFDIGFIPPGARLDFEYQLQIGAYAVGYAEFVQWNFSDPLTIETGGGRTEPLFSISPVPEPATWASMISGLALIGAAGMRRRSTRQRRGGIAFSALHRD